MGSLFGEGSLFSYLSTAKGATFITIAAICFSALFVIMLITKLNFFELVVRFVAWLLSFFGKIINKKEKKYHRDLEIGKINEKRRAVKMYRFLYDLIIDLQLKQTGIVPYEFLFIVLVVSFLVTIVLCMALFGNVIMSIVLYPIITVGTICALYTKANIAHESRIEAVIESENIISNGIRDGVVVSIQNSIQVLPKQLRPDFKNFLDNVKHKNYHIKTALLELNNSLGSVSDDFIKKCIVFEMEEEHGVVNTFKDVVEINGIKTSLRTEMKHAFEQIVFEFIQGAGLILFFLIFVLWVNDEVRKFYLTTWIGQTIIAVDILILIAEFVYITYLRAKEV